MTERQDQQPDSWRSDANQLVRSAKEIWDEFDKTFPSEEECLREICNRILRSGLLRCSCGSKDIVSPKVRLVTCNTCGDSKSLTVNTFFARMKIARAWLGAIYLIEGGATPSSVQLHQLAGVAQSSALNILKRLHMAISAQMNSETIEVESAKFISLFCKRSRETPAGAHPRSEELLLDRGGQSTDGQVRALSAATEDNSDGPRHEISQEILSSLSEDECTIVSLLSTRPLPISKIADLSGLRPQNLLAALSNLEISGLATRLPGNKFRLHRPSSGELRETSRHCKSTSDDLQIGAGTEEPADQSISRALGRAIARSKQLISERFRGISRKCLQLYLAAYWCTTNPRLWKTRCLVAVCMSYGPLTDKQILEFITPPMVKLTIGDCKELPAV